ncbi:MAG: 1-acyl-sn-glycerol-3-phosphate acyltransferase [Flavobacteriales bacterium]|nr:1-acyl-sn-glycerol-3-phosphate acyltransferase [Flavobacteriales bacterium]
MHWIARAFLKLIGWKLIRNTPLDLKRCVALGAPHTSNMDGIIGVMALVAWRLKFKFLIKKDLFFFPFGAILKALGGLPVDRSKKGSLTDQAAAYFQQYDDLILGITPEGTRSYNPNWKKGFYYIAEKAQVPIVLGYIDFEKKEVCMDRIFERTGNVDEDILRIKEYYKDKKGKYPEKGVY